MMVERQQITRVIQARKTYEQRRKVPFEVVPGSIVDERVIKTCVGDTRIFRQA
jgi:hypothetical protein